MRAFRFGAASSAIAVGLFGVASVPTAAADGGQYVRTQSGKFRCLVSSTGQGVGISGPVVVCEPRGGGVGAAVDAAGNVVFRNGNIGAAYIERDLVLAYGQTYQVQGWTIAASSDGTRFTNNATGHGLFLSVGNTYAF
jgi:hypothetical protein